MINLINKKFGELVVIEKTDGRIKGSVIWKCQCSCGELVYISAKNLKRNFKKCIHNPPLYKYIPKNKRRYSFNLTKEEFGILTKQKCIYCNKNPEKTFDAKGNGKYIYNGIDRIDNTKGYEIDNVVTCCWECNRMKGKMSIKEFINHITKIAEYGLKNIGKI